MTSRGVMAVDSTTSVVRPAAVAAAPVMADRSMATGFARARAAILAPDRSRADQKRGQGKAYEHPGALHSFNSVVVSLS